METLNSQTPQPSHSSGKVKAVLRHSLFHFLLLVICAYQIKEFYPFTHIPMYSDPEARAPYMFLTDVEGNPIGVRAQCGVTNPKMRKMYHGRINQYCKENDCDVASVPPETERQIALDVLTFLRKQAVKRNRPLPDTVRLMSGIVLPADDGFQETFALIIEG